MALETQHRIVEAIEIIGADPVTAAFLKLAGASEEVAKALGHTKGAGDGLDSTFNSLDKDWFAKPEKVIKPPKAGVHWWEKFKKAAGNAVGPMTQAFTVAGLIEKAISFVVTKMIQWVKQGWAVNEAFEAARSRVQGMALGLVDFGNANPLEKVQQSLRLANVLMEEFDRIGMKTATDGAEIEKAYTRLNAILSLTGRSQYDIVKQTELAAAAAKVYGENAGEVADVIARAISEGSVRGTSAFARSLKASAKVTPKMTKEQRYEKVTGVLEKMGEAVGIITDNTAGALKRWENLSTGILQKITLPIYNKIGEVVASIVRYMEANEGPIQAIVTEIQEWLEAIWSIAEGVWDVGAGILELGAWWSDFSEKVDFVWKLFGFVRKAVSLIGLGLSAAVEWVRTLVDPDRGMGKLNTMSEALKLLWVEIAEQMLAVVEALAKLVVPEFMRDLPGLKQFFAGIADVRKDMRWDIDKKAATLRELEKKHGTGALTDSTRGLKRIEDGIGLSAAEKERMLRNAKGIKVIQNIDTIEIYQDFREEDPDHVIVEFVTDLERIGENALQSTAGGMATAFEGSGSSY